jgi:hypothetical protein
MPEPGSLQKETTEKSIHCILIFLEVLKEKQEGTEQKITFLGKLECK